MRFDFASAIVHNADFAVSGQDDLEAFVVTNHSHASQSNGTTTLALQVAFFKNLRNAAADVERTHRQLRAGFTDTLCGDDSDGHPFFDQRTGRKVHAVATSAQSQRCIAGHR